MGKASWAQDPDVRRGAIERETVSPRPTEDPDPALNLDRWRHEPALMQDCPRGVKPWSPEGPDYPPPVVGLGRNGFKRRKGSGAKRPNTRQAARNPLPDCSRPIDRDGASGESRKFHIGPRNAKAGGHIGSGRPPRLRPLPQPVRSGRASSRAQTAPSSPPCDASIIHKACPVIPGVVLMPA